MADIKKHKPLMFGDATFDAARSLEAIPAEEDNSYVPGYSEKRRANEILIKNGQDPEPIPRLQWIPIGSVTGEAAPTRDTLRYYKLGYRFLTKDALEGMGYQLPPAAHVAADGTIRREDLGLAAVDWETYQTNKARLEAENRELERTPMIDHPDVDLIESHRGIVSTPQQANEALSNLQEKTT